MHVGSYYLSGFVCRYYLFWNAEYMPGRHAFTVAEACESGCESAHRERKLVRSARHHARARG